ncbi:MAG: hypothetical protein R3274_01515 [Desulfobacterales bacterium]|nr:hypothetical protein [Desulfobacterales bacterium]
MTNLAISIFKNALQLKQRETIQRSRKFFKYGRLANNMIHQRESLEKDKRQF